ncbi:hypothetical protein L218DRAFT_884065, partial [Marasmius fiardii PR-910]
LPDIFTDFVKSNHERLKTQKQDIFTHCKRELMHAVWRLLLNDEFVHAFKYGIVIKCADGVQRCIYPRIFTYSADYPEKVLLANIHDKGLCPCPRCLVPKSFFSRMGTKLDLRLRLQHVRCFLLNTVILARHHIYKMGRPIGGKHVKKKKTTQKSRCKLERRWRDR